MNAPGYLMNVTDSNAICIPVEAFAKLQATSMQAFTEAVNLYLFIGIGIGICFTLGVLFFKHLIDSREVAA